MPYFDFSTEEGKGVATSIFNGKLADDEAIALLHSDPLQNYLKKTSDGYATGIAKNRDTILEEKKREAEARKAAEDKYKELEAKYKDIDLDGYNAWKAGKPEIAAAKEAAQAKNQLQAAQEELSTTTKAFQELMDKNQALQNEYDSTMILYDIIAAQSQIANTNKDSPLEEGALEFFILKAKDVFKREKGRSIPYQNGAMMTDAKGEPLSVQAWIESHRKTNPLYFKKPSGGGASGGGGGATVKKWQDMTPEERALLPKADYDRAFNEYAQSKKSKR